ncbi:MAG: Ubiquitin ligase [Cyanobacteria bacterium RYN_339]|nr:Ubiquitin ligase [Cyanobacteria bacterium RYN_339]
MGVLLLIAFIYLVLGCIVALCMFVFAKNAHELSLVTATATSAVRKARRQPGQRVELKGTIECDEPLVTPASGQPCVYYHYQLERQERPPRKGDTQPGDTWVKVVQQQDVAAFWLRDRSGKMIVAPTLPGCSFHPHITTTEHGPTFDGAERWPGIDVGSVGHCPEGGETLGFRVTERVVPVGQRVYVLGTARARADDQVVIDPEGGTLLLSVHDEPALVAKLVGECFLSALFFVITMAAGYLPVYFFYTQR